MPLETFPFVPGEYINTAESAEEFLRAAFESAFEENTPEDIPDAFGVVARSRGMSALARETGLSRQALYKALSAGGNPSFATIVTVAHALGFRLVPEPIAVPEPA